MNGAMFVDGDNICMHFKDSGKKIHLDEDIEWEDLFLTLEIENIELIAKKFYIAPHSLSSIAANNLGHLGFTVRPTETYGNKSLTDAYLIADAMEAIMLYPINVLIIVSGDKDYLPLARKAREKGIEVVFVAFDEDTAEVLKNEFKFIDMTPFVRLEALVGDVSTVGMSSAVEVKGDAL